MRRLFLAVTAASMLAGAAAIPAAASATEVQIGQTATALVAPTCPAGTTAANCKILLTQMTGLQTLSDSSAFPTAVKSDGVLTGMTVGISSAAKAYVSSLDKSYGGAPEVELTVLRPVGADGALRYEVAAESAPQAVTAYMGSVVQFPLGTAIPVVPGELIGLTAPTWAPVLSIQLSTTAFAYRQAVVATPMTHGAAPTCFQNALATPLAIGNTSTYGCNYTGNRLQYTATEIITPTPTASIRLARRLGHVVKRPRVITP
jgi:hypothetical protein